MNSFAIEIAKTNSPAYMKNFDRTLELTKNRPKIRCLNVIGVKQEYSGGGGHITSTFSRGKIYFIIQPDDGRSISRNVAHLNILVHDVINLLYYEY